MPTVSVFGPKGINKIGDFTFHRIPVKGDYIDIPTHGHFEVMAVILPTERPTGHDNPIVIVKMIDLTILLSQ